MYSVDLRDIEESYREQDKRMSTICKEILRSVVLNEDQSLYQWISFSLREELQSNNG